MRGCTHSFCRVVPFWNFKTPTVSPSSREPFSFSYTSICSTAPSLAQVTFNTNICSILDHLI